MEDLEIFLSNKNIRVFFLSAFIVLCNIQLALSKEMNAEEIFKSCKNYFEWVNNNYSDAVDDKTLFNMGKCQGVIETLGKTMLTLCHESRRNVNINNKLTANLEGIKTIDIIENFLKIASADSNLRDYSSSSYLYSIISKIWPCR